MSRDPIFPTDWIAPGEFRFCGRCGDHLVLAADPTCGRCKHRPSWEDADAAPDFLGARADGAAAEALHARLRGEREALAAARRAAGVEPLFWMRAAAPTAGE